MLRLKIGKNFLLLNYHSSERTVINTAIPYMMGCFEGTNLLASCLSYNSFNANEVCKNMDALKTNKLYLLQYVDVLGMKKAKDTAYLREVISHNKEVLREQIKQLKEVKPLIEIKVININAYMEKPEYKVANSLYQTLLEDNSSILSVLPRLETYKTMNQRYASIPNEIKIIDNDIKRMEKKVSVCERVDTLESLKYLKLIDTAKMVGSKLRLTLHPLTITPSEPFGKVFAPEHFHNNPYLFKVASYLYQGYHFQMPGTEIEVDTNFRLQFLQTLDHRFDRMFARHNWSRIGYPHFGDGGFCAGEFNDTMAHGREYGLGYYFVSLKQYLGTANMRDLAGVKVFWYPIYNDEGEMVYCAGLDIAIEEYIRVYNPTIYEELKTMTWEQKAERMKDFNYDRSEVMRYGASNLSYGYHGDEDAFLKVCQTQDIDLYNKIMEGRN
jgi:hypothetical protein